MILLANRDDAEPTILPTARRVLCRSWADDRRVPAAVAAASSAARRRHSVGVGDCTPSPRPLQTGKDGGSSGLRSLGSVPSYVAHRGLFAL